MSSTTSSGTEPATPTKKSLRTKAWEANENNQTNFEFRLGCLRFHFAAFKDISQFKTFVFSQRRMKTFYRTSIWAVIPTL